MATKDTASTQALPRIYIARQWRQPRFVLALFIFEIPLMIAGLALYGIADPDLYRTRLWLDGFLNGFNSSPTQVLLAYANHVPFAVPLVWSPFITTFNLVISVLSMFILLVKAIAFILHLWPPILSLPVHAGLFAVWVYSAYAQTSSDLTDPQQLQPGAPWYITHSCNVAYSKSNVGYCKQAKASLAIAILMAILFGVNIIQSAWSCVPTKRERHMRLVQKKECDEEWCEDLGGKSIAPPVQQKTAFVKEHPLRSSSRPSQEVETCYPGC